ncbi:reverse transcriptase domain-containing protein [Bacillus sp. MUM 13]|uniref:reverse transcriptase domain-containing protein n=1 Tax=Bacillus sp. MUM 13 TaxID=1678001 RepID=UPI000B313DEE|nr:reverse transcriptase domain-containing protein [Bacillus sp. MUM 13]
MNQEWKFKLHSVYGQLLFDRKLTEGFMKVKNNKGAGGIDGETIESYEGKLEENILKLLGKLKDKTYQPQPVKRVYIPKKDGKKRPLGIPTIEDRIVQQSVVNVLQPKFEDNLFHSWSVGYRPNRGVKRALQIILWNIEQGYNHIYDCDIKGFFDNIPHEKLISVLKKYVSDRTVLNMIRTWLKAGFMDAQCLECILLKHFLHMGKPYALIGHVRFDKGEATRVASLLYFFFLKCIQMSLFLPKLWKMMFLKPLSLLFRSFSSWTRI